MLLPRWGLATAALAAILLTSVAACGGGPTTAESRSVGTAALSGSHMKVATSTKECIGRSMIDAVGLSEARKATKEKDVSKLSKANRAAAANALNDCVPSTAFATAFVDQFSNGQGDNKALEVCLGKQFKGQVGSVISSFSDPKPPESVLTKLDKCPTGDLARQLVKGAIEQSSVPAATVDCALGKLGSSLTLRAVLTQSNELESRIESAMTACKPGA
jgi:hypothetical protein